jgi:glycosyltransferase involved in cell wall biosynthesis
MSSLSGIHIVCLYPWTVFQPSGAWTRFYSYWRYLLLQGAEVTIACIEPGKEGKLGRLAVKRFGKHSVFHMESLWQGLLSLLARTQAPVGLEKYGDTELQFLFMYDPETYHEEKELKPWLEGIIATADLVSVEYPMYVPLLSPICEQLRKPLIVNSYDAIFALHGKDPQAKGILREKEIAAYKAAKAVVFCSSDDRALFPEIADQSFVIPNTVDAQKIIPGEEEAARQKVRESLKIRGNNIALFVGSAHGPNNDAAQFILSMAPRLPDIDFIIAGKCLELGSGGNLHSLGEVTETVLDLLHRAAHVVLVPLTKGTGTSLKLMQAMAYGKPILTTSIGARGQNIINDREVVIEDSLERFPATLLALMSDTTRRERLALQARAYALSKDFRKSFAPYADIIKTVLARSGWKPRPHAKQSRSLILVDNNLKDDIGHHLPYARSLQEECRRQGYGFKALANAQATDSIIKELDAQPLFDIGIHEVRKDNLFPIEWGELYRAGDFFISNDSFCRKLESILESTVSPGDVIFVPNATLRCSLGIAMLLARNPELMTAQIVLLYRYPLYHPHVEPDKRIIFKPDQGTAEFLKLSFDKLLSQSGAANLRLTTDSTDLTEEYQTLTPLKFSELPIPHTAHKVSAAVATIPKKVHEKIRLIFLGDAREEKGFALLPQFLTKLASSGLAQSFDIVIQAYVSSSYHETMYNTINEIKLARFPFVQLIERTLSDDEYGALIESTDIVLLPYHGPTYRARTSGPLIEALCAEKVVVVPKDSWLHKQLNGTDAGVAFNTEDAEDLARAVLQACRNLERHKQEAKKLGAQLRGFHSPQNFISELFKEPAF